MDPLYVDDKKWSKPDVTEEQLVDEVIIPLKQKLDECIADREIVRQQQMACRK